MRLISCRNFRKTFIRKIFPTAIITALVFLLFLFVMSQPTSTAVNGDDEKEKITIKFCEENRARRKHRLASFLQPESDTAIIVPKLINATSSERKFIACFVLSSPENAETRRVIRDTWGTLVKPIFVIGRKANTSDNGMTLIRHEADVFDDMVMENFIDTYDNLTLKTGFAMKTFLRYFNSSSYFMKIDDDVLLNVDKLYQALNVAPNNSLIGRITHESPPVQDINNKWFMPECMYADEFYPDYLQGPSYIIPGHMIEPIFTKAQDMAYFNFEDVFWTGLVARQKFNMSFHNDINFTYTYSPDELVMTFPCLLRKFIAIHKVSPKVMIKSWQNFVSDVQCSLLIKMLSALGLIGR